MNDDLSILGSVVVYRRIPPIYLNFDANGLPIMSDGAFRTKELSVRRCDKVTEAEMLKEGDPTDGLATITIQAIRDAGCIVVYDEPPDGHICGYRKDAPGSRISSSSAAKMARAAKWVKLP